MIDLHCHMLPAMDDGSLDVETSLQMARVAVADGITHVACTPHIYPGLYNNSATTIQGAVERLQNEQDDAGIALTLSIGADIHLVPDVLAGLRRAHLPTINDTRYLLLEPSHHIAPPRYEQAVFELIAHGYVPLITHPERLAWIESHYHQLVRLAHHGAWLQLTAASFTGHFGRTARYWAERMLGEGVVHVLASDAHDVVRRPPVLSEARLLVAKSLGAEEAAQLVEIRPAAVWSDKRPNDIIPPPGLAARAMVTQGGLKAWGRRLFGR